MKWPNNGYDKLVRRVVKSNCMWHIAESFVICKSQIDRIGSVRDEIVSSLRQPVTTYEKRQNSADAVQTFEEKSESPNFYTPIPDRLYTFEKLSMIK